MSTCATAARSAVTWFEIPVRDLDRAQSFYETLCARPMRRETIGESRMAVFAYEEGSVGGCLIASSNVPAPSAIGTIVYLDVSPSLNEALTRLQRAGGQVALARTELPDGMGCFAQVIDSEGNRVGLHAPA